MSKRIAVVAWLGVLAAALGGSTCLYDYVGAERCSNGTGGGCGGSSASMTTSSTSMATCDGGTDSDCGGDAGCQRCAPGKMCKVGSDCDSAVCAHGTCAEITYTTRWKVINAENPPPARYGAGIAALADGSVLLTGGYESAADNDDTWQLGGDVWTPRDDGLLERHYAPMAFHESLGKALIAGGFSHDVAKTEAAWFDPQHGWTTAPKLLHSRYGATLVYDSSRETLVLFGGLIPGGATASVEELGATDSVWQSVSPGSINLPKSRYYHSAIYDQLRHKMIVFGGEDADALDDTWLYSPSTAGWVQVEGDHPPARYGASMAYDSQRHVTVLFGGRDDGSGDAGSGAIYGDTWEFDGSKWHEMDIPPIDQTHPKRFQAAMAYDATNERMVLFGGTVTYSPLGGTYAYIAYGGPCPPDGKCKNGSCTQGICCDVSGDACPSPQSCITTTNRGVCADAGTGD